MELKEKLASELLETTWEPLAPHFAKGVVYLLDQSLDIVDVAEAMAIDDVSSVKEWLSAGVLYPPTDEEATLFSQQPDTSFLLLIVEPYVLIQRKFQ